VQPQVCRQRILYKAVNERLASSLSTLEKKPLQTYVGEHGLEVEVCNTSQGAVKPGSELRHYENVTSVRPSSATFPARSPHTARCMVDQGKRDTQDGEVVIVGNEINLNHSSYKYAPARPLA
jgi:hypothetical protein